MYRKLNSSNETSEDENISGSSSSREDAVKILIELTNRLEDAEMFLSASRCYLSASTERLDIIKKYLCLAEVDIRSASDSMTELENQLQAMHLQLQSMYQNVFYNESDYFSQYNESERYENDIKEPNETPEHVVDAINFFSQLNLSTNTERQMKPCVDISLPNDRITTPHEASQTIADDLVHAIEADTKFEQIVKDLSESESDSIPLIDDSTKKGYPEGEVKTGDGRNNCDKFSSKSSKESTDNEDLRQSSFYWASSNTLQNTLMLDSDMDISSSSNGSVPDWNDFASTNAAGPILFRDILNSPNQKEISGNRSVSEITKMKNPNNKNSDGNLVSSLKNSSQSRNTNYCEVQPDQLCSTWSNTIEAGNSDNRSSEPSKIRKESSDPNDGKDINVLVDELPILDSSRIENVSFNRELEFFDSPHCRSVSDRGENCESVSFKTTGNELYNSALSCFSSDTLGTTNYHSLASTEKGSTHELTGTSLESSERTELSEEKSLSFNSSLENPGQSPESSS